MLELEREVPTAPHWPEAEYTTMLHADEGEAVRRALFVAEDLGRLLGFVVVKVLGGDLEVETEIESVVVHAGARREGLGRALCGAAIQWSQDERAETVGLEVRAKSEGALLLYKGLGFVAVGRRAGYYREPTDDAVVMRLKLDESRR